MVGERRDKSDATGYVFSFQELEEFLWYANSIAPIVPMRESTRTTGKCIILRQDVDLDICPSYEVAQIQKGLGIASTFFVLVTAPTYNPQAPGIRKMLTEMVADGFEIGLHFDPTVYAGVTDQAELQKRLEQESRILEDITGEPVVSISLHNPSIHGEYPIFDGYVNAYSKELFSDEQYLSDSMRVDPLLHPFRGKDPYEFVASARKFPLQIALHPEQFLEKGGSYLDTIDRYVDNTRRRILEDYERTLSVIRGENQD